MRRTAWAKSSRVLSSAVFFCFLTLAFCLKNLLRLYAEDLNVHMFFQRSFVSLLKEWRRQGQKQHGPFAERLRKGGEGRGVCIEELGYVV